MFLVLQMNGCVWHFVLCHWFLKEEEYKSKKTMDCFIDFQKVMISFFNTGCKIELAATKIPCIFSVWRTYVNVLYACVLTYMVCDNKGWWVIAILGGWMAHSYKRKVIVSYACLIKTMDEVSRSKVNILKWQQLFNQKSDYIHTWYDHLGGHEC